MKFGILQIVIIYLTIFSTSAQNLLKGPEKFWPKSFGWKAITQSPTGVDADGVFRVDGNLNIFSYTVGYLDTAFHKYTNVTYSWDFVSEESYIHTTGDDYCMMDQFNSLLKQDEGLQQFVNRIWQNHAVVINQTTVDGVEYSTVNLKYDEENNLYFKFKETELLEVSGQFLGDEIEQKVTEDIKEEEFELRNHIPASCKNISFNWAQFQ
ncbi:unnamed protein product [Moneuplotes crassus]|uniref:DUF3108 domain-containing protein n=1 Tax=Euplotes crassus TaxID=5936 RepID=A0AAD2D6K6_EUPCR|nr:unnamed protein product [Moneuplotes crassus]